MIRPLLAAAMVLSPAPRSTPADYQLCTIIHNGPIEQPDHYSAHPYGERKADLA